MGVLSIKLGSIEFQVIFVDLDIPEIPRGYYWRLRRLPASRTISDRGCRQGGCHRAVRIDQTEGVIVNHCVTCAYWEGHPTGTPRTAECRILSVDENGYTPQGDNPVAYAGGQELPAWLSTRADFGCLLWTEKTP